MDRASPKSRHRELLGRLPRRLLSGVLLGVAGLWLAWVIRGNLDALRPAWASLQPLPIAVALVPAVLSRYFVALAYWILLRRIQPATPPFGEFMVPFFASQVVRYLPGRVWAVAYQANVWSGWLRLAQVWEANLVWLLIVGVNGVLVPVGVWLASTVSVAAGAGVVLLAVAGLYITLRTDVVGKVLARFVVRPGAAPASPAERGVASSAAVVLLLEMEWLAYFVAFAFLLPAGMALMDVLVVVAAYAMASVFGILVFVLPDGILVREALFIEVARRLGYAVPELLLVSAVARVVFVVVDTLALATAAAWRFRPGRASGRHGGAPG